MKSLNLELNIRKIRGALFGVQLWVAGLGAKVSAGSAGTGGLFLEIAISGGEGTGIRGPLCAAQKLTPGWR